MIIIVLFVLLAYKFFIERIVKEKNLQHEAEIQHQKNLTLENTKTQEEERKRMAILIHDDIGNRLNILSLWLQNLNADNKETSEKVISNQISELIDSARSISHSLYPVNLEKLGLVLYIEELITNLSNKIKITLYVTPEYQKKDIFIEVQLYRIIQEFTTNVIKHSRAAEMSIYIKDIKNHRIVILSDNGESFDYHNASKGMGLKNIESRIKSLNAVYKWKNRLGKGSRLIIIISQNNTYEN